MKRILSVLLVLLALLALGGCNRHGEQAPGDVQSQLEGEGAVDYDAVIRSIAGTWDWPGGTGHPFYIHNDGSWEHSTGDTGLYGNVRIVGADGDFLLEFIVTRAEGAGVYGSPGIPAGEGWRYGDLWGGGVYSPAASELRFEGWDGSMVLMERSG